MSEYPDQKAIDALYDRFNKPAAPQKTATPNGGLPTVEAVIEKLRNEKTDKGAALFNGDTSVYPSRSEADLAIFAKAYFYTQDYDQCVAIY